MKKKTFIESHKTCAWAKGNTCKFWGVHIGNFTRTFRVSVTMIFSWPTPSVLISKDLRNEKRRTKDSLLDRRSDYKSME